MCIQTMDAPPGEVACAPGSGRCFCYQVYVLGDTAGCPTGSGCMLTLREVADEIAVRLCRLFLPDDAGRRACHGDDEKKIKGELDMRTLTGLLRGGESGRP